MIKDGKIKLSDFGNVEEAKVWEKKVRFFGSWPTASWLNDPNTYLNVDDDGEFSINSIRIPGAEEAVKQAIDGWTDKDIAEYIDRAQYTNVLINIVNWNYNLYQIKDVNYLKKYFDGNGRNRSINIIKIESRMKMKKVPKTIADRILKHIEKNHYKPTISAVRLKELEAELQVLRGQRTAKLTQLEKERSEEEQTFVRRGEMPIMAFGSGQVM